MTPRFETPFEISLGQEDGRHIVGNGGSRDQLSVQLNDGVLHARWPANPFEHPPQFKGRLHVHAGEAVLTGTIRESRGNRFLADIWGLPTVAMVALAVVGAALVITRTGHDGLGALLFGGTGSILAGLLWRWQRKLRRPTYDRDARKLDAGLRQYLMTGDGTRPVV